MPRRRVIWTAGQHYCNPEGLGEMMQHELRKAQRAVATGSITRPNVSAEQNEKGNFSLFMPRRRVIWTAGVTKLKVSIDLFSLRWRPVIETVSKIMSTLRVAFIFFQKFFEKYVVIVSEKQYLCGLKYCCVSAQCFYP